MDGNNSLEIGLSTVIHYEENEDHLIVDLYYNADQTFYNIERFSNFVILPIIGIVGLVGNALNGVIMVKDGLHKPSNILLLGLAVADFLVLLHTIDISYLMTYATPIQYSWVMDLNLIFVCYNLSNISLFLIGVSLDASVAITVFITLERVIAVYFPLRYSMLVTPKGATFVVILCFLMGLPAAVCNLFRFDLITLYDERIGGWAGGSRASDMWQRSWMRKFELFRTYTVISAPTMIVTIGCLLIGVKIAITIRRRKKLTATSKNRISSARTRTLFMVSFVFIFTHSLTLFSFLLKVNYKRVDMNYYIQTLFIHTTDFLLLLNSSCNVFIYVVFNPKFRTLLKQQLPCFAKLKKNK